MSFCDACSSWRGLRWGWQGRSTTPSPSKLLGRRFDLVLPHLAAGYVMFKENPRTARVYEYARADGERHDLADLVATPSPGYARARALHQ